MHGPSFGLQRSRGRADVEVGLPALRSFDSDDGAWAVRVHIKPFVRWIWLGALLMGFGGLLAAADKRYRIKVRTRVREALGMEATA